MSTVNLRLTFDCGCLLKHALRYIKCDYFFIRATFSSRSRTSVMFHGVKAFICIGRHSIAAFFSAVSYSKNYCTYLFVKYNYIILI